MQVHKTSRRYSRAGPIALLLGTALAIASLAIVGASSLAFFLALLVPLYVAIVEVRHWFQPRLKDHPNARIRYLWVGVVMAIVSLNVYAPGNPTTLQRVLASTLLLVCFVPVVWWLRAERREVPFLPAFGGLFALSYAVPIFLLDRFDEAWAERPGLTSAAFEIGQLLALGGFLIVLVSYHLAGRWRSRRPAQWIGDFRSTTEIYIVLGVIGVAAYVIQVTSLTLLPVEARQVVDLASSLSLLAIAGLAGLHFEGSINRSATLFLFGVLIPIPLLIGFGTSSTAQGLEVILAFGLAALAATGRIPWALLLIGFFAVAILQPVKEEFRRVAADSGVSVQDLNAGSTAPLLNGIRFLETYYEVTTSTDFSATEILSNHADRWADVRVLAAVVESTPADVPYWSGESLFLPIITKPIPRFLLPGKPLEDTGQRFGHRYGFIHTFDSGTSVNLPWTADFYANFGLVGLVSGMTVVGILLRLIPRLFGSEAGTTTKALAIFVMLPMLGIGSAFSASVGGSIQSLIVLWLLSLVLDQSRSRKRRLPAV